MAAAARRTGAEMGSWGSDAGETQAELAETEAGRRAEECAREMGVVLRGMRVHAPGGW